MEPVVINQLAGQVSQLLLEKLGAKGPTLERRLAYVRRGLPKRVQRSGDTLVNAQKMGASPQLAMKLDEADVARSYDTLTQYLDEVDAGAERSRKRFNMMAGVATQVILFSCCFAGLLAWRGYI